MIINNWNKLQTVGTLISDISVVATDIIRNPSKKNLLELNFDTDIVYTTHIGITTQHNLYTWVNVIVFPMAGKFYLGMGRPNQACQLLTPLPIHQLKSPDSFLRFIESTFNNTFQLSA